MISYDTLLKAIGAYRKKHNLPLPNAALQAIYQQATKPIEQEKQSAHTQDSEQLSENTPPSSDSPALDRQDNTI